ncbi:MAG: Helicase associated domain protein, partial [Myxococcales bacterium]|nr:Helicase associated domain protein [Myxococcales bacterium]
LSDENLAIRKRLFFTATPRHYDIRKKDEEGEAKLVFSMDNKAVYGPVAHRLNFAEAANRDIICNYKVVISVIDGQMVDNDLISRGETLVKDDFVRSRQVAVQLALQRTVEEFGVGRIITFHASVKAATSFIAEGAEGVQNHLPDFSTFHVNGKQRTADREDHLRAFAEADKGLITNARCLTEGVDVPAVDMVAFVAPRRSKIDIVQATGRAMRKAGPHKEFGYVFLPLFLEQDESETLEEALGRSKFDEVAAVLNAMQEQDEELTEIIRKLQVEKGRIGGFDESRLADKVITIGPRVGLAALRRAVSAKIIETLGSSWYEWFGRLKVYTEREGHCRVPQSFQSEDRYALGNWVAVQRTQRETMSVERKALLDELDFVWNIRDAAWGEGYEHLKMFREREGHCRVSQSFQSEGGYPLGVWVSTQRRNCEKMSAERRALLDELGFDWGFRSNRSKTD